MWINRLIEGTLTELSQKKGCIVVTGARQTGKSSILQHLFPDIEPVSLDLPRNAEAAETSGEEFLNRLSKPAIIDEVQYAPKLFRYLKADIDSHRFTGRSRYLLTGSQKFQLMESVSESLSGRAALLELHSLSTLELEGAFGRKAEGEQLWEWIFKGGYPEIYEKGLSPERFFTDYVSTYIERDVRKVLNVKDTRTFDLFLRLLSTRVGQLLSYNSIATDLGVSATTVKQWIDVLVLTNVIGVVSPWFTNSTKRLVKTPKMYFLDTGLACFLAGMKSVEDLLNSPVKGAFFENHVYAQMVRSRSNRGSRPDLYFFRDHQGNEIDFLESRGGNFIAYECKSNDDPKINKKPFEALQAAFPKAQIERFYINSARGPHRLRDGVVLRDSVDFSGTE